ncbi:hypothetical protein AJ79_01450 [Helicocarpus griseus UAMH5409]|uniref:Uncharacterized protein n=1 Tax=Helicocarpus griseus UAMH5409 TaxID=1447875 RepID=A0A2B7Y5P7_9EURO|nr:hypothetical protein AJ79_01450 [Helicocarpus griseus UAMH5409]
MYTNAGNEIRFVPEELSLNRPGEVDYTEKCHSVPDGEMLTGFYSILEAGSGIFQTFGVQTARMADSAPLTAKRKDKSHSRFAAARLCSSLGSNLTLGTRVAYTSASFVGLKRIRFSSGSITRPRDSNEVSGLWLDYFEEPSEIVGRWLLETDSMGLEEEEAILAVTIWISRSEFCHSEKISLGRVIRISVLTTKQEKTVCKTEQM